MSISEILTENVDPFQKNLHHMNTEYTGINAAAATELLNIGLLCAQCCSTSILRLFLDILNTSSLFKKMDRACTNVTYVT